MKGNCLLNFVLLKWAWNRYGAGAWIPTICGQCKDGPASRTRSGGAYVAVVDSLENEEDMDDFPGVMACAKMAALPREPERAAKPKAPLPPPPVLPATPPPLEVVCFNLFCSF